MQISARHNPNRIYGMYRKEQAFATSSASVLAAASLDQQAVQPCATTLLRTTFCCITTLLRTSFCYITTLLRTSFCGIAYFFCTFEADNQHLKQKQEARSHPESAIQEPAHLHRAQSRLARTPPLHVALQVAGLDGQLSVVCGERSDGGINSFGKALPLRP